MAHAALRKMTDHILQVAEYFIDTFGRGRVLARAVSPTESNALISPKILEEFSMPYVKELNPRCWLWAPRPSTSTCAATTT